MTSLVYLRVELLRTLRNRRLFILSLVFPLGLYVLMAATNADIPNFGGSGISVRLYYMVGMAAFGTMAAMLAIGARVSTERAAGWTRQLRITPLPARAYLRTKVLTGYVVAIMTLGLLYLAGTAFGVRLPAEAWLRMTQLLLVGLIPFAAFGIWLGHVLAPDAIGPATGATTALLAFVSGSWYPLGHGALAQVATYLPSYWLVQAGRAGLTGDPWPTQAWIVVLGWSLGLAALAARAYRRNNQRV